MRIHLASAAMAILVAAAPVHANDRTAHQVIAAKDFARAERMLVAERRASPGRPELALNLAAVYLHTGRAAQARALYAEVLNRPATELDMLSGKTVTSHDVASTALASLDTGTALAAR